ncbi:dehydrogenase/reductase SDR family member 7 [Halyomorpha halys]|uniref:dehydrogenase/reductase SDR family member 7 n=1 Tax=Halyomorpha halys TaxID=286706 RepID=UPI0006D4F1F3|nr:dehydrogenase/reductase SDR family member 7 [Halyomorpha halys]
MDLFTLIGLYIVGYILCYVILLSVVDCDIRLLWSIYFGRGLDYFQGKIVWITGASSGIGEFLAVELARNGASIVLSARSLANLERVKVKCIEAGASLDKIFILPMDVTETEKHEEMFLRVVDRFGRLDILVNNAGRSQRALWEDIELEVDRQLFELNVFSVISLSRLAVKYFEKVGGGHIVVTSSLAGVFGAPFSGSYTAAKHALHGYFKTLLSEKLGGNIALTLLCPGPVFSNLLPECFTDKSGKNFGEAMGQDDKRMTTSRCAYLCAVAMANKLDEAWMGLFPVLPLCYMLVYHPGIAKQIALSLGTKQLLTLRDSRQTVVKKES